MFALDISTVSGGMLRVCIVGLVTAAVGVNLYFVSVIPGWVGWSWWTAVRVRVHSICKSYSHSAKTGDTKVEC